MLRPWPFTEAAKLSAIRLVTEHLASLEFVDPPMQFQLTLRKSRSHDWVGSQIFKLRKHVFLDRNVQKVGLGFFADIFVLNDAPGGLSMAKPLRERRKIPRRRWIQQAFHCAAMRMAADDDVLDSKACDSEFNCGRLAAHGCAVGWNKVSCVAHDEQTPRAVCVSRQGSMRESEQVMNKVSGAWPAASRSKSSCCVPKILLWNS